MFGADLILPEGIIAVVVGVSFTSVIALMAWIVRELSRISSANGRQEERLDEHERRLNRAGF